MTQENQDEPQMLFGKPIEANEQAQQGDIVLGSMRDWMKKKHIKRLAKEIPLPHWEHGYI